MVAIARPAPTGNADHLGLVPPPSGKRGGGGRGTVMIPATIVCPDGVTHACVIRDMSVSGAELAALRRHRLPAAFSLAIPARNHACPVVRMWQRSDFAGVALAPPPDADPA